jgi:hypothetical protein
MNIDRTLRDTLWASCRDARVRDVRIGITYIAVQLEDNRTGVAYTQGTERSRGCSLFLNRRPLAGRPAEELLDLLDSSVLLERCVGLATANAVANVPRTREESTDVLEVLSLTPKDTVAMIGFFQPLIPTLKRKVGSLKIFEAQGDYSDDVRPADEAHEFLCASDVALITSTTIANRTLERLLKAAERCREVVLLGSSTPLVVEAFHKTPITLLSGITINDPEGILRLVSEGGGTRFFKPFVTKVNIPVRLMQRSDEGSVGASGL